MSSPADAFLKKLLGTFRIEAGEHIDAISSGLLALEGAPASDRAAILERIFREVHSLKGAARAVNLEEIETICHVLESGFAQWRKDSALPPPEEFDAMHAALDRVKRLVSSLAPAPIASEAALSPHAAPATVRIDAVKLDTILRQTEELFASRRSAAQRVLDIREIRVALGSVHGEEGRKQAGGRLARLERAAEADHRLLASRVDALLRDVREAQMLPFSTLSDGLRRVVRNLGRDEGKAVELTIDGGELRIDRRILDGMTAPLHHLLRNAVDHGIEEPAARERQGKPPQGVITIGLSARDSRVMLSVTDDGGGIDVEHVRSRAAEMGLAVNDVVAAIFQSGFSTSSTVTEISGRGLGLAIVREKVEWLGGSIAVETRPGAGTAIQMDLPLTLAILRGVLVRTAGRDFIIPAASVERVTRIAPDGIATVENREMVSVAGRTIPLVHLSDVLELPRPPHADVAHIPIVVLGRAAECIAFRVDEVIAENEFLVRNLGPQLARVRNIAGASVLGTGEVTPVLNVSDLMISAVRASGSLSTGSARGTMTSPTRRCILVVEDSITSRTLLKNILEAAGHDVAVAVDGIDAWTMLRTRPFDLLVSDIEMPRMDGLTLTAKVRGDQRFSDLPVILVTALDSREHRERGIDVGANAYIVKSSFDQSDLLEAIRRLIGTGQP